jgi:hypothetical protein
MNELYALIQTNKQAKAFALFYSVALVILGGVAF